MKHNFPTEEFNVKHVQTNYFYTERNKLLQTKRLKLTVSGLFVVFFIAHNV